MTVQLGLLTLIWISHKSQGGWGRGGRGNGEGIVAIHHIVEIVHSGSDPSKFRRA